MEYKIHIVYGEEKLSFIADKYNTTPEEIKALNPNMKTFGGFIGGLFVAHGQQIKIPISEKKIIQPQMESYSDNPLNTLFFTSKARYRCEQINNTKINRVLTAYTNQQTQYLLEQNLEEKIARIKLEDFIYNVSPPVLASSFELVKATEFIKNNVYYKLSEKGQIEEILNRNTLLKEWKEFIKNDFYKIPFIQSLNKTPDSVKNILESGDKQFTNLNIEEYKRNLFNFICFDQYLYKPIDELEEEEFLYPSTLLPPIIIPLKFRFDKVRENNNFLTIKKIATIKLSDELKKELVKKYDETLKPIIKFSFTEFKIIFRCTIEFDRENKQIEKASVSLKEEIADNMENTCEFTLERLLNYIP